MSSYVGENECAEMRRLADEADISYCRLGEAFGRHPATVSQHIKGQCQHQDADQATTYDADSISDALHELADDIGAIPSGADWDAQTHRPCGRDTVIRILGGDSWLEALSTAGFPELPERAPAPIRKAAYQKPELCTHPND